MNILITGTSQGIGKKLKEELKKKGHNVVGIGIDKEIEDYYCNVAFLEDCIKVREKLKDFSIDVLINNAGENLQCWFEDLKKKDFDRIMSINCFGHINTVQAFLDDLKTNNGTVINIISNASHIPMTCSLAYNCSKSAASMATKQMAHEMTKKYGITFIGINPNKVKGTEMSKVIEKSVMKTRGWTAEYAAEYQKKALLTGKETTLEQISNLVISILEMENSFLSGCIIQAGK